LILSIVNGLLLAATPLLLAVSRGKRKPVRKKIKRSTPSRRTYPKRPRAQTTTRDTKRLISRAPRGKSVQVRPRMPAAVPATPATAPKPVEPEPPPKPVPPIGRAILLSPENEKFVDSFHPTFRWLSVGGATRYEIAWGEDAALNTSHSIFSIATEATVPVEQPLRLGGMFYWRVRGGNESGWGPWSAIASFRVLEEAP
jgi:hypothetical protein